MNLRSIIFLPAAVCCAACTHNLKVELRDMTTPEIGTRYSASPAGVTMNEDRQPVAVRYRALRFDVSVGLHNDSLVYRLNDTLSGHSTRIAFLRDSVAEWSRENSFDNHAVRFASGTQSFFLIPGTAFTYNEPAYNLFPMMICYGNAVAGRAGETEIFVDMNDCDNMQIRIREEGRLHHHAVRDCLVYKDSYSMQDTIPVNGRPYTVAEFTQSSLTLTPAKIAAGRTLDRSAMAVFGKYFDGRDYLFVDFWGTWCRPCVESMPRIKELYTDFGRHISFLSVCYDDDRNSDTAEQILRSNGIEWADMFVSENDRHSIVRQLNISSFPTYMIVSRSGVAVFLDSGTQNIPHLRQTLCSLER